MNYNLFLSDNFIYSNSWMTPSHKKYEISKFYFRDFNTIINRIVGKA